jgi:hypothetical protein
MRKRTLLKIYWNYFKYIMQHKWFVFVECIKIGIPIHGITHDLSKFLPSEFCPYAIKFFSGDYAYQYFEVENNFDFAWLLHQHRNKHHWDYWVNSSHKAAEMPPKYVKQMVADWRAMGRKFGDTANYFYRKNQSRMLLHHKTRYLVEQILEK